MTNTLASSPKATFSFDILEVFEGGLVLTGPETASARRGNVNLKGAFVTARKGELFLRNAYFGRYEPAGKLLEGNERRERKILVHKKELREIMMRHEAERLTLIPLNLHLKGSRIKLSFALARGKRKHEKREAIKKRDVERDIRRALKQ